MKKRIAILLCAVAVMLSATAMAWEDEEEYYPIMVESYTMGSLDTPCIKKVYQLSLSDAHPVSPPMILSGSGMSTS